MENSTLFKVDMAISPEKGSDMSGFVPDFASYDLVVLDYNGDMWPEETKANFVKYVKKRRRSSCLPCCQ
ncbi:MAG: hypothetical protein LUH15_00220 [Tannerellaceae bacterium]|nr:hypothetical protein [Tannerellaceae bacterium]